MAKGLTIELKGINEAIAQLRSVGDTKVKQISNEIKATAYEIASDAQRAAPVDLNALRGSIRVGTVTEDSAEVSVGVFYAAYVEFGTGDFAAAYLSSQSDEIAQYAKQFFVNGKGHMPARPFFFPAVYNNYNELVKRLVDILKK